LDSAALRVWHGLRAFHTPLTEGVGENFWSVA